MIIITLEIMYKVIINIRIHIENRNVLKMTLEK